MSPKIPSLPSGSSRRGAQYGRVDYFPDPPEAPVKLHLYRLRFIDGGYDEGGAYWGSPANVYRAVSSQQQRVTCCGRPIEEPGHVEVFVRADDRAEAKALVLKDVPGAKFFR